MKIKKENIIVGILGVVAICAFIYFGDVQSITNMASSSLAKADTTEVLAEEIFTSSRAATKKTGAFGESVNTTEKSGEEVAEYIRRPKDLPSDFTGYKVELVTVYNEKLSLNDEIYQKFGGIHIEQRTDNSYTYLIGDFRNKAACDEYLSKIIKDKFKDAKGVKYKNGQIVSYK